MTSRKSRLPKYFRTVLIALAVTSVLDYRENGELTWPRALLLSAAESSTGFAHALQALAGNEPAAPAAIITSAELSTQNAFADPQQLSGIVFKITDGDTFKLRVDGREEEIIRLHGIDAPERDQPHGSDATAALSDWIASRQVTVQVEDTDNYGRLVGTVFVDDENINLAMVSAGHAWWYEYYAKTNHELETAQGQARSARRGLWSDRSAVAPWDWRRAH